MLGGGQRGPDGFSVAAFVKVRRTEGSGARGARGGEGCLGY